MAFTQGIAVVVAVVVVACASACETPRVRKVDIADALFVRGENEAAAVAYDDVAVAAVDSDQELRARFFALAARRASASPEGLDKSLADLRAFAAEASSSQWGRIAAVLAADIEQGEVLRRAVMRSGADLAAVEAALNATEEKRKGAVAHGEALEAQLGDAREERALLQRAIRDLEDKLAEQRAKTDALLEELDALKRIDMERAP
jgi:chromosome segregation ATPase